MANSADPRDPGTPGVTPPDGLRRWPDIDDASLESIDAADRLLLAVVGTAELAAPIVVVDDRYGALALGLLRAGAREVRVWQDSRVAQRALAANAESLGIAAPRPRVPSDGVLAGAPLVLARLPRGLDALDEVAATLAAHVDSGARVVFAGMVKHMTIAQTDRLRTWFGDVRASRAVGKARLLVATGPLGRTAPPPGAAHDSALGVDLRATGRVFGGVAVDRGTRLMLEALSGADAHDLPGLEGPSDIAAAAVIDLGSGNGTVAATLAVRYPGVRVLALDESASAVAATAATAEASGVADRITAVHSDALEDVPTGSARLILLNPPFHAGSTVHAGIGRRLFRDAARALSDEGRLWVVFNSHLRHRAALERLVGPTRQVARDATFTVTVSVRRR